MFIASRRTGIGISTSFPSKDVENAIKDDEEEETEEDDGSNWKTWCPKQQNLQRTTSYSFSR